MNDLRFAFRQLRYAPAFTVTALATIAICLGANLAIFAVIDAILLRPLPFPQSDRLVAIFNTYPKAGVERDGSSLTNYYERRGNIPGFSSLSIFRYGTEVVGETGSTQQENVMRISPDFFTTLGTGPVMGRSFDEAETITPIENHGAAIVTDGYWRQRLNSDPHVLGREIRVNGAPRKIVGVLPPDFRFLSSDARIFLPLTSRLQQRTPQQRHSGGGGTHMIARLKPGATVAEAQSQIDAHNAGVEKDNPQATMMAEAGFRSPVLPLHADHVRSIRPTLLLMQVSALFLLVMGAVNLVNLLLIRASSHMKDMAIRRSMGASRRHVVSHVMVETLLLTALGGLLGLVVGASGIRLLEVLGADRLPLGARIAFDGRLAATGLAGAVLLGVVIAVPIAWFNLRSHLENALRSESRTGTVSRAAQRLRQGFIVAQIALAFVLLAGAALLGLSLKNVMAVSPGFRADHVLIGQFTLPYGRFPGGSPQRVAVLDRLLEAIGQQPGVAAAGTITNVPLSGDNGKTAITPMGYVPQPGESLQGHYFYGITGDYFSALGIPLREGRFLTSADSHRPERVCVVDEDFARRYWPKGDALGQRVFQGTGFGRRTTVHHCRRRRRRKTSGAHGTAGAGCGLRALPLSRHQRLRGDAHEPAPGSVCRFAATIGARHRSGAGDRRHPVDGYAHRGEPHRAPLSGRAGRDRRRRRAAPGGRWNIRRPQLHHRSTPARNRHSHGARCADAPHSDAIPLVGPAAARGGDSPRCDGCVGRRKGHGERPLRRAHASPRHSFWDRALS